MQVMCSAARLQGPSCCRRRYFPCALSLIDASALLSFSRTLLSRLRAASLSDADRASPSERSSASITSVSCTSTICGALPPGGRENQFKPGAGGNRPLPGISSWKGARARLGFVEEPPVLPLEQRCLLLQLLRPLLRLRDARLDVPEGHAPAAALGRGAAVAVAAAAAAAPPAVAAAAAARGAALPLARRPPPL